MSYLPDIYQQFGRAFPNVHAAHQELAKACYKGGPLDPCSARLVKLGVAIVPRPVQEGSEPRELSPSRRSTHGASSKIVRRF
jgi:hypothetical protein